MILVLNCGSQSVKWEIFKRNLESVLSGKREYFEKEKAKKILEEELKKIKNYHSEINFVAHRVVHGGKYFQPTIINSQVIREIEKFSEVAPLHNPFEILGIKVSQKIFQKAKQIAVFDTEFFKNLPEVSKIYPLPKKIKEKYFLRRFGFHGLSHKYLTYKASEILKKPLKKINLITLHLGGGASITAIKNGQPIETSMGFTPLAGLLMTTRSGDIDPGLVLFLVKKIGLEKTEKILNFESGLKAISGYADFRKILVSQKEKSKLALEIFVWQIKKYLGAYYEILNGKVDGIVFSGAIGAGLPKTRKLILKNLTFLKKTKILAIKTNEAYQIAKEIKENFDI